MALQISPEFLLESHKKLSYFEFVYYKILRIFVPANRPPLLVICLIPGELRRLNLKWMNITQHIEIHLRSKNSDDYIFVNDFLVVIVKQVQRHVASQYRKQ